MEYLETNNYIYDTYSSLGFMYPIRFKITGKGFDWMNNYNPNASNVQNINFKNNYGSVGNNNTVNIHNYFSFENLDKTVDAHLDKNAPERQEIEELKQQLKFIQENQIPISKGYLKQFSALMQKHSWLASPITSFLIQYFFR